MVMISVASNSNAMSLGVLETLTSRMGMSDSKGSRL